ncbi:plasma membrane calcium-transporting ATPase 2 isoform X2, partial [Brachionus plicatilis]
MAEIDVKLRDLKEIMELKNAEARDRIKQIYGDMESFAKHLKTNLLNGLIGETSDLENRVRLFGKNEIAPKPPKSIFRLAFEALKEPLLILLMVCGVISIGLSFYHPKEDDIDEEVRLKSTDIGNLEWVEGVAIAVSVIVVVAVSSFNDWRKERKFRGLQDRIAQENKTSVVRNGQIVQINVKELVVGDICCIKYGDLIPADGIVTQASDLKIDEASLTGETDLIKKNDWENVTIFSGTHVMEGTGQFLVTAVGLNSQTGIIMTLLGATSGKAKTDDDQESNNKNKIAPKKTVIEQKTEKKQKSVLQSKLTKLVIQITYIGITAAVLTFLILLIRMLIVELEIKKKKWNDSFIRYILSYLIQGITVMVVAVPEGLPLAVTLALAFAVQKMTKDNNLVRHLDACETMGNATTICSDKTGTLTTNRMTVVQCWVGGIHHKKIPEKSQVSEAIRQLICESASVNSNYTSMIESTKQEGEMPKQIGNKTECALLGFVNQLGGSYEQIRNEFPNDQFVKVYTFNSARKMMSTIVHNSKISNSYRMYSKGASEMVLAKCGWYLNSEGKPIRLSADKIDDIVRSVVEPMAMDGLRTICVASRDFIPKETEADLPNAKYFDQEIDWNDEQDIITDLTCLCLVGIEDPVRPEVPDAISKCQTSGVTVRMVTGDNINTATSIAMKCGIIKPGDDYLILESHEFNKRIRDQDGLVKQDLLDKVWPRLRVLARSSPTDKYILVNGIVESKSS